MNDTPWSLLSAKITKLSDRIDRGVSVREATVSLTSPLSVQFDTDSNNIRVHGTLQSSLRAGDRVLTLKLSHYVWILGVKGADNPRRFATKSQLDTWPAPDGTMAWVTSMGLLFIRESGVWRGLPGQSVSSYNDVLTLFPNAREGDSVYRQDLGRAIWFVGGAWVLDEPLTTIPWPAGFTGSYYVASLSRGIVTLQLHTTSTFTAGATANFGPLPAQFRPTRDVAATAALIGEFPASARVTAAGAVWFRSNDTATRTGAFITATYPIY